MKRVRDWTDMVIRLSRDGLKRANPGLSQQELDLLWIERQYGADLAPRVRKYLESRPPCPAATP
jgi:hypothetical protein